MSDPAVDLERIRREIEAEVRARRVAGEYPPGFERELDELFARFAPPEVTDDFEAALEHAEELVVVHPTIPVVSRNPAFGIVKRIIAKLLGWYHVWLAQQLTALASAITTALRQLGRRVVDLEHTTGDATRTRAAATRIVPERDDRAWEAAVTDALRDCSGRVAVIECGRGELVLALTAAGVDAYGVDPRSAVAADALARGAEVRVDDAAGHLHGVEAGALGAVVLRALVERSAVGELLQLVDAVAVRVRAGGRLVVCSVAPARWGQGATAVEADLVAGRPLHPETWAAVIPEQEFVGVRTVAAGDGAYVVIATRADHA